MKKTYLYETHSHTKEASACATWSACESVDEHKKAGYAGLIITNHFYYGNTSVDRTLPWREWVEKFCYPYNIAKEYGEKVGLQVFFGWESCYSGTEFLIYGLSEEWLKNHEEIRDASIAEQYEIVHNSGGLVIHPHPFRKADYIKEVRLFPEYIDGVEAYNASHSSPFSDNKNNLHSDEKAIEYAKKINKPITAGSDSHHLPMLGGGMVFDRRIEDINDFCQAVINRECIEYRNK